MKLFSEKTDIVDEKTAFSDVKTNLKDIEKRLLEQQRSNELYLQSLLENMSAVPNCYFTEEIESTVLRQKHHKYMRKKLYRDINFAIKTSKTKSTKRMINMDDNIIVLNDENGNEVEFEFLDLIPYQGQEYAVLLPNNDEANEVGILQLEEPNDDSETYLSVDDETIVSAVFDIFKTKYKDEFNFID